MAADMEGLLAGLVGVIAAQPQVQAIGLAGGDRPLPAPSEGDLDLFIYCSEVPPAAQRAAALAVLGDAVGALAVDRAADPHWGIADVLELGGVETWLMHFRVDEALAELEALLGGRQLGRVDEDYYPLGRCAMYRTLRALYDPAGLLAGLRTRVAAYPPALAAAVLAHHLAPLDETEDLERAARRGDVLFYHSALELALDHYLQALFALNRTFFPSRKRSLEHIRSFTLAPHDAGARLVEVVRLGAEAHNLPASLTAWMALVRDLQALAGGAEDGSFACRRQL